LARFRQTFAKGERALNIRDGFQQELERRFIDHPTERGIQFKTQQLNNADIRAALASLRNELGELQGVRVVLLLPDSLEAYLLHLHLFLEGAVIIPISVQAGASRIQHICEIVCAELIVTTAFLFNAYGRLFLNRYTCLVFISTQGSFSPVANFEWVSRHSTSLRTGASFGEPRAAEPVRYILFTSGSTGTPKGVCLSDQNVLSAAQMMVQFLPLDTTTLSMVTVPLYDYYGMIQVFGHILGNGAFAFGMNSSMPNPLLTAIVSLGCTDLVLVPYTLRKLIDLSGPTVSSAFGTLKRLTSSSDMLTEDVLDKLFHIAPHITIVNIYGLTEAGRACSRKIGRDTPYSNSIGFPSPGVEIVIQNDTNGEGEIIIRGPNVMLGYLAKVENDRIVFEPRSEMPTGDLGYRDANGEIILLGRRDHMINLMGVKIHPSEIEAAALKAGVADARARVYDQPGNGKVIHLDVVCKDSGITVEGIIASMRASLPRAFLPQTVTFVPGIQRTDLGSKIIR
jgi:long-chain acyl-CoA synthetase